MPITAKFDAHPMGLVELECDTPEEFSAALGHASTNGSTNGSAKATTTGRKPKRRAKVKRKLTKKKPPSSNSGRGWEAARQLSAKEGIPVSEARSRLAKMKKPR